MRVHGLSLSTQVTMATRTETSTTTISPEIEAFVRLVRAGITVTRELSDQLNRDHGLTINAYEALLGLARAPDSRMRRGYLPHSLPLTCGGAARRPARLERERLVPPAGCVLALPPIAAA